MTSQCWAAVQAGGKACGEHASDPLYGFYGERAVPVDALGERLAVQQKVRADPQRAQKRQLGVREAQRAEQCQSLWSSPSAAHTAATWRSSPSISDVQSRPPISSLCRPNSGVRAAT